MGEDIQFVRFEGELIKEWKFIEIDPSIRLHYKYDGGRLGFKFYCSEAVSWHEGGIVEVECLFNGVARFDGIRHFYVGDEQTDNYGYLYYFSIPNFIGALKILRELEIKYCRDYEGKKNEQT